MADELGAIADAQHGHATYKLREVYTESLGIVHRIGRAAEDDTDDGAGLQIRLNGGKLVVRQNLAKGVQFSYTPSDKLCGLGTEIKDNNLLHIVMKFDV